MSFKLGLCCLLLAYGGTLLSARRDHAYHHRRSSRSHSHQPPIASVAPPLGRNKLTASGEVHSSSAGYANITTLQQHRHVLPRFRHQPVGGSERGGGRVGLGDSSGRLSYQTTTTATTTTAATTGRGVGTGRIKGNGGESRSRSKESSGGREIEVPLTSETYSFDHEDAQTVQGDTGAFPRSQTPPNSTFKEKLASTFILGNNYNSSSVERFEARVVPIQSRQDKLVVGADFSWKNKSEDKSVRSGLKHPLPEPDRVGGERLVDNNTNTDSSTPNKTPKVSIKNLSRYQANKRTRSLHDQSKAFFHLREASKKEHFSSPNISLGPQPYGIGTPLNTSAPRELDSGEIVGEVSGTEKEEESSSLFGGNYGEYEAFNSTIINIMANPRPTESPAVVLARLACEKRMNTAPYPTDGGIYCNRTFDGWGCFNDTKAGHRVFLPCPTFKKGFDKRLFAYKDCNPDGTWWKHPNTNKSWTNYTTCVDTDSLQADTRTMYIFFAGYSISIIALLASLFIFFYFRQLQCDRVTIHKNLFLSYILNGIVWILYYSLAAMSGDTMLANPEWCQVLHVITQYFVACNFFWMFCEGLYLHTIIVSAFTTGRKLIIACYIIGWCVPVLTTCIYTILRANNAAVNARCWSDESSLQYIVVGPIVLTIGLNLVFLFNIVRVLITKLRAVNSPDTNQTRKAVRATLILIPLLGLQYILFPLRPAKGSKLADIYPYVSAFVTSFQGLFVALIFCFCNGEVMSVLKRKWGQHRLMHGNANGRTGMYTQTTVTMENTLVQSPKSPRLYDNRSQAPGGKPSKGGINGAHLFRVGQGGGRPFDGDYMSSTDSGQEGLKCTSSV